MDIGRSTQVSLSSIHLAAGGRSIAACCNSSGQVEGLRVLGTGLAGPQDKKMVKLAREDIFGHLPHVFTLPEQQSPCLPNSTAAPSRETVSKLFSRDFPVFASRLFTGSRSREYRFLATLIVQILVACFQFSRFCCFQILWNFPFPVCLFSPPVSLSCSILALTQFLFVLFHFIVCHRTSNTRQLMD